MSTQAKGPANLSEWWLAKYGTEIHAIQCTGCKGSGERSDECPTCNGGLVIEGWARRVEDCPECNGSSQCPTCSGWGEVICESETCAEPSCVQARAELEAWLRERGARRT